MTELIGNAVGVVAAEGLVHQGNGQFFAHWIFHQACQTFGLLLFTMKGVAPTEITMGEVIGAALPYLPFGLLLLVLIFFVPPIATWLPSRV